jgi:tetratricopeptide (TPR) repeat protein
MRHPVKEEILRAWEGGRAEIERLATHLAACPACRALAAGIFDDRTATAKRAPLLKILVELAGFEKAMAVNRLLAKAEMAELRRLTRGAQKERVILSRFCHSPAFLDALLDALRAPRSRDESESLANLGLLAVQGIDPAEGSEAFKNDLLAMIWIETANARRIRGEWQHARTALLRADAHSSAGTGDPSINARWLSIAGSLQCDQGRRDDAMVSLEECRRAYSGCGDWPLVGRTLVKMAHCIGDDEPEHALILLDRASTYIPLGDTSLRCHAEQIRTDCLVTVGRLEDALRAFAEAERLRPLNDRPSAALRSTFFAARLLEYLGDVQEAEALFDAVVAEELDRGHFKDAALDLVYTFGFHLRLGSPDRAADLGLRALGELDRRESSASEQCRLVLAKLIDAARGQCLDEEMLRAAREYLRVQWNRSAPGELKAASDGERVPSPANRPAITPDRMLVEPLLARALWSRLRGETRRQQHARVIRSPEYHTTAFVELLLTGIRQAPSREDAEFTASLALQAIAPMDAPFSMKHDLQAQLWTEVANIRRVASEWSKATAALLQAEKHLAEGSGDPLLKARSQSISASLSADQGRRVEALSALEECVQLYESQGAWPLVAQTMVKMAHTLMDADPARALMLAEQAFPMIPSEEIALRCHAENIRTDCMISLGEIERALRTFDDAEPLRRVGVSPVARRRSDFFAARLLEYLDHNREAVQLFEAVIADAFDHEAYREAFLDLLYLFSVHLRHGATDKAVALCRFAIARLDLFDVGHQQVRTVWVELRDAAMRRAIRLEALAEVRDFLKVHWKTPAPPRYRGDLGSGPSELQRQVRELLHQRQSRDGTKR